MPTKRQMEAMLIVSVATISGYHFLRLWGQKRLAQNPQSGGLVNNLAEAAVWN
jgi:hypothetical protein